MKKTNKLLKLILLVSITFSYYSCDTKDTFYLLKIQRCNGIIDTIYVRGELQDIKSMNIATYNHAVPILHNIYPTQLNVCDYLILKKETKIVKWEWKKSK